MLTRLDPRRTARLATVAAALLLLPGCPDDGPDDPTVAVIISTDEERLPVGGQFRLEVGVSNTFSNETGGSPTARLVAVQNPGGGILSLSELSVTTGFLDRAGAFAQDEIDWTLRGGSADLGVITVTCTRVGQVDLVLTVSANATAAAGGGSMVSAEDQETITFDCVEGTGGTGTTGGSSDTGDTGDTGDPTTGNPDDPYAHTVVEGTVNDLGNGCFENTGPMPGAVVFTQPHDDSPSLEVDCTLTDDPNMQLASFGRVMAFADPADHFNSRSCLVERSEFGGETALLNAGTFDTSSFFTPAPNTSAASFFCDFDGADDSGAMTGTVDGQVISLQSTTLDARGGDRVALRLFRSECCLLPWTVAP